MVSLSNFKKWARQTFYTSKNRSSIVTCVRQGFHYFTIWSSSVSLSWLIFKYLREAKDSWRSFKNVPLPGSGLLQTYWYVMPIPEFPSELSNMKSIDFYILFDRNYDEIHTAAPIKNCRAFLSLTATLVIRNINTHIFQ